MSIIREYISQLKNQIEELPFVLSENLFIENRGDVVLYLKGEVIFANHCELHFREYFITIPEFEKIAYSCHYQAPDKKLIFRYDNAEHHPELDNYPHHKHDGHNVYSAEKLSVAEVLKLIIDEISKKI